MSPTSYQTAPSRVISFFDAGDRNRTGTVFEGPQDFKSCASASSATPASFLALGVGLEPTTYRLTAGCSAIELPKIMAWRRATLPGRLHPSTIAAEMLNFRVRYGNGCVHLAIVTRLLYKQYLLLGQVLDLLVSLS